MYALYIDIYIFIFLSIYLINHTCSKKLILFSECSGISNVPKNKENKAHFP